MFVAVTIAWNAAYLIVSTVKASTVVLYRRGCCRALFTRVAETARVSWYCCAVAMSSRC